MKQLQKILWIAIFGIFLFWISQTPTTHTLPQIGEAPILYSSDIDDDLKVLFEDAIQEANQSVLLIIYSLLDRTIIQSLKQKAEEGVKVTVICDPEASAGVEKKLGPKVETFKRRGKGIMHQKILVTDNNRVWIGSANMTNKSLRVHGNLVIGFYSPQLASLIHDKAAIMIDTGMKKTIRHRDIRINDQKIEMWFLPEDKGAISRLKNLIKSAQKTIQVAMFTWTRIDLAEELVEARNRGVHVEVALDRNSAAGVSKKVAQFLQDEGIPITFNSGDGLLHHKMMVIDDETLVIGSANWTRAAFEKNNDCFIVIHPLTDQQKTTLHKMWKVLQRTERTKGPKRPKGPKL
jgi:cardiolipin synthase